MNRLLLKRYTQCYFVLSLALVGCQSDPYSNTSSRQHESAEQNCIASSEQYATAVCGELDKVGHSINIESSIETNDLPDSVKALARDYSPTTGTVNTIIERTYNVLRKDLGGELKDTRRCRDKMASMMLKLCDTNQCIQRCDIKRRDSLQDLSRQIKRQKNCEKNHASRCKVQCRMGSGMSKAAECNRQCAITQNPDWKQICRDHNGLSREQVQQEYRSCSKQCRD